MECACMWTIVGIQCSSHSLFKYSTFQTRVLQLKKKKSSKCTMFSVWNFVKIQSYKRLIIVWFVMHIVMSDFVCLLMTVFVINVMPGSTYYSKNYARIFGAGLTMNSYSLQVLNLQWTGTGPCEWKRRVVVYQQQQRSQDMHQNCGPYPTGHGRRTDFQPSGRAWKSIARCCETLIPIVKGAAP